MEEYKNNQPQLQEDDEFQIDWAGILTKILKHWKQILVIGFVFGVMGIFSALTMKRMYAVKLTLAPEIQSRGSSSLSSMASMLGLGGINMSAATDATYYVHLGIPIVIFAAESYGAHAQDERGSISSLHRYADVLTRYLLNRSAASN